MLYLLMNLLTPFCSATVANISKIFSDTFAALEQDVQQEIKVGSKELYK